MVLRMLHLHQRLLPDQLILAEQPFRQIIDRRSPHPIVRSDPTNLRLDNISISQIRRSDEFLRYRNLLTYTKHRTRCGLLREQFLRHIGNEPVPFGFRILVRVQPQHIVRVGSHHILVQRLPLIHTALHSRCSHYWFANHRKLALVSRCRVSHVKQSTSLIHDNMGIHRMLHLVLGEKVVPRMTVKCLYLIHGFPFRSRHRDLYQRVYLTRQN